MSRRLYVLSMSMLVLLALSLSAGAELYKRAPDAVRGTTTEMRDASYWVKRMENPDEVVMPLSRIQAMNTSYVKWINRPDPFAGLSEERMPNLRYWWPGYTPFRYELRSMTPTALADTARARIEIGIAHMRKEPYGNLNAVEYAPWQLDDFEAEMNVDALSSGASVLDAIAVTTTRMRVVPTWTPDQVGIRENAKTRWDLWNVGIVKIGMPLAVIHRSRSGEYVYAYSEFGFGWVPSRDIAFSTSSRIDEFVNADDFAMCTGDRVQFYSDETCTYASGWFRMGDRLPLASKNDSRRVVVPVRKMNGEFTTDIAWLADDADVSVGYLPYTRRNVVETAFKLLDNQYDWTGAWFGRQHETTYRDIFKCFGFELPYYGALFTFFNSRKTNVLMPDVGVEEQYRTILANDPFVTLQSCGGHCQLLLGDHNGVPVIFDQHGYGYEDESGDFLEIRRCCVGDQTLPSYFLKSKITFLELR